MLYKGFVPCVISASTIIMSNMDIIRKCKQDQRETDTENLVEYTDKIFSKDIQDIWVKIFKQDKNEYLFNQPFCLKWLFHLIWRMIKN